MMTAERRAKLMIKRELKINGSSWVAVIFLLSLFHHTLEASQTQIFSGPVSMSMGGGGRAGAEATEKIFLNPASVVLGDGLEMGMSYRDGYWAKGEHETGFNLVLIENDADNFAKGGIAYARRGRTARGAKWTEQYVMGALGQTLSPHLSVGASVYHLMQDVKGGPNHTHWNGSLGLLFTITPNLGIAYVFDNPIAADKDVPDVMKPIPQQSVGLNVQFEKVARLTLDLTRFEKQNPDKKGIIQVGNEVRMSEFGVVRVGVEIDDIRKRNSLTAGFGFLGPRLRANYAFVKPFRETDGAMHSVDLRLPF